MSKATEDVLAERQRQAEAEGWTDEHDDAHGAGELAAAGMGYAQSAACQLSHGGEPLEGLPLFWPWAAEWWKPKTPRRDLVRAAALLVAEIERLDRAAAWKTCNHCTSPEFCRESVRGCDLDEMAR